MGDPDNQSPKGSPRLRRALINPFAFAPTNPQGEALGSQERITISTTRKQFKGLETQPTLTDLVEPILDPSTPRTPTHQHAEYEITTGEAGAVLKRHMDAVVKIFATHSRPNFELPWQVRQQTTSKSTGFSVRAGNGARWLLTNAHSVTYASQVTVKRRDDDERFEAKVHAVGTECDVAILTVEDEEFWNNIVPLELSIELPELQESVAVVGYPIGGDSLAISAGVVSRVQMTHYSHGCMSLLAVQTDSAINSGNSGGPVLDKRGHCIGIAFQSLTGDAQSVGYVIPTSVVRHFIDDVERNGRYTGFPALNISWQELDSSVALKRAYGLHPHQKGILVRYVAKESSESEALQVDDVIMKIGGVEVGADGSVPFRHGERVNFKYLITNHFVGDDVELDILRRGKEHSVKVKLSEFRHLIPPHLQERKASYLLVGGLVFTACNDPYLIQRYGGLSNSPVRLMAKTYFGIRERRDHESVVLSNILACSATMGYDSTPGIRDSTVISFNGEKVWSLLQLAKMVRECKEEFMRFDMESGNKVIIMETKSARNCTEQVMQDHNIPSEVSKDLEKALASNGGAADA